MVCVLKRKIRNQNSAISNKKIFGFRSRNSGLQCRVKITEKRLNFAFNHYRLYFHNYQWQKWLQQLRKNRNLNHGFLVSNVKRLVFGNRPMAPNGQMFVCNVWKVMIWSIFSRAILIYFAYSDSFNI